MATIAFLYQTLAKIDGFEINDSNIIMYSNTWDNNNHITSVSCQVH